ncbi:hypothetical protein F53441_12659 [Fusarium austroafricanum]|uniref:Uncharacterized protein n=1 Tax=Fusarium austroafricanum TaxID=2364996 RepID=A0A8H4JXT5_9HYPO|nr:hypothetical protein F53441_12659 [Fusarium austroafricanum]
MPVIENITLVEGQRLALVISINAAYPDLDLSKQQTQNYKNDVLYDAQSKQIAQRPAVIKKAGVWVSPQSYPDSYTSKNTTYWRARDDQFLSQEHTWQWWDKEAKIWKPYIDRHFWTSGITCLTDTDAKANYKYLQKDPFAGSGIKFPTTAGFPYPTSAFAGSIGYYQKHFIETLNSTVPDSISCKQLAIPNLLLPGDGVMREVKLYDPKEPAFNFASFKFSVLPTLSDALDAQKARAAQVVITTTLEASDFTIKPGSLTNSQPMQILHADFTGLIVCQNIFLEISGYIGADAVKTLVTDMAKMIWKVIGTVPADVWKEILSRP